MPTSYRKNYPLRFQVQVFAKSQGRCFYCGGGADVMDHVVPVSSGGRDAFDNLVPACWRYEGAVRTFMEMTVFDLWDHRTLAATYGQLGRIEEARKEWTLVLAAWQVNMDRGEGVPSDPVVYALEEELFRRDVDRQHWLEGLRKADVTE